jgi:OPA family sugar phosphate sensor protein UhpC-like MFS transporter
MAVKFIGGFLLHSYGWRYSFFGLTILTCFIWVLIYLWQRNRPEDVGLEPIVQRRTEDDRAVRASEHEHVTAAQYFQLAFNPVVLTMGISYFCIKFLRYALDSWLPAFLNYQGMDVGHAAYYSAIFDWAGLGGAILAGIALDRVFRGNWALLCFCMGVGMIAGYLAVIFLGTTPTLIAVCFGAVGFMIYGPDTLLCGAASVAVAGERNGVAVAGLVNGIASIGPIFQEEIIGWLMRGDVHVGMRNTNRLALAMSITFTLLMIVMMWRLHVTHKGHRENDAIAASREN